jgi:HSP20 family molecular chaperone IbpA
MEDIFNLMKKDSDFLDDYFFSSKNFFRGFKGPNMEQLSLFKETENSYDAEIKVGEIIRDTLNVEVDDEKHLIHISYSREMHEGNISNCIIETIPNNSDINQINASYNSGILNITIPKIEHKL